MEECIDFQSKFFNLEGVHYNERKKNFYKLLSSTDPHTLAQLDLQPRNYLEKMFYVDILIHGKQVDKLVDILKDGNGILTSKILKQKWFFEEAFRNMSEDTIVNDFLPTLSYSLRMKVLKKLSLSMNEERMDNIFELLIQKYGLYIAQQFLFSCSSTKIVTMLRNNKITLSVEQLKRILDRDSDVIKVYFEEYKKNTGIDFDDYNFLSYLAWKYPNLYFEFASYFRDPVKVGRRTTISVLKINKEEVLKDVNEIQRRFNVAAVTRQVKIFDKEYLYKLFPDNKSRFKDYSIWASLLEFLKKYPLKNRWDIFSSSFKKAYDDDPTNHLELFDEQIATMFPNKLKQKWAEVKFKETDKLDYVRYFEPKKAFILLKDRLNVTSAIRKRTEMLKYLVRNCHENKDYNTYEAALKYICYRHRNDDSGLRADLLHEISNNIDYELSTETLWKYINELVDLNRVKGEPFLPFQNICQYVIFAFKNKLLSLSDTVAQFVKDCAGQKYFDWNLGYFDNEPNIKAELFKHVMTFLHTINPESKKRTMVVSFMGEIVNFNNNHKDLWIDLNESLEIIGYLKELLLKQEYDKDDILSIEYLIKNNYGKNAQKPLKVFDDEQLLDMMKKMVQQMPEVHFGSWLSDALLEATKDPRRDEFQNRLLDYYFTEYLPEPRYYFGKTDAIQYFLTKEPEVLAKYFDHILPMEVLESMLDYSIIKLYSHLALDEKLINHLKPLVSATSTCESKTTLIVSLSKIMPADDFIHLIAEYVPKKFKLDLTDSEQKSLYEAQCVTAKALTNLDQVEKVIPLLYPFCQGDYLQSSLPVLYKVLYRVSEKQAVSFINVLVERAASAKKHAVYLSFGVLPHKAALDLFNITAAKESNSSAKKYLFKGILQYFLKNPSKIILDMVLTNLTFVDKNDEGLLETLTKHTIQKCPSEFRPAFVEQLWNYLGILEKEEVKVVIYRCWLLVTIDAYDVTFFLRLKDTFCQRIIEDYFFSNNDALLRSGEIYEFVAKYLLAHNDDQHFKFVFNIIQNYRDLNWKSNNNEKVKYLFEFFERVYNGFIDQDVEYLNLFKSHWERVFTHEECFFEYVVLRLMVLYKESLNISEFAKKVSKCFEELILGYGAYINDVLLGSIKAFFLNRRVLTDDTFSADHFALHLLEFDSSEINCFLAASIVADCAIDEHKEMHSKLIETLKSVNHFTARLRYNCFLRK